MHELSIAMSIIDIAAETSRTHDDARVIAVHLKIGRMSGVVIDALLSAFTIAKEDTVLANAKLMIEDLPVKVRCPKCQCERLADSIQCLCCSVCRTVSAEITQGDELDVVAVELEPLEIRQ
ncbi:Hydrogenase expression/synthesis, HypA [Rhodopirellula maiorica SM1]|uniref:Hydrogenase maturation factor HypA n=1 Tax=Rhodopirellula maiorica SM1 TaxID=1265738 RepID=M5RX62_9BACT|nr:hydrogenase maturation nickel metallochaperone HypA [Rhodopirellula maiorica]EMI18534.1 Hydrogenase expression/synthesis, HypA [Rhodopirellula maiorica SM1]